MTPPLAPEQAAELYRAMLRDVLDATALFAADLGVAPVLAVHPEGARAELAAVCPVGFRVVAQRGADLAERMAWAVGEAAAAGAERILLRGSDSPLLDRATLAEALSALEASDLVICPDLDGGYGLVGLRRPVPGLFDHAMSTSSVLADTLERAHRAGLRTHQLPARFDLDTADDLCRLAAARAEGAARHCANTIAYLDRAGLWP